MIYSSQKGRNFSAITDKSVAGKRDTGGVSLGRDGGEKCFSCRISCQHAAKCHFPSLGLRVPKRGLRNVGRSAPESPNLSGCSFRLKVVMLAFYPPDLPSGALGSHDLFLSQSGSEKL